MALVLAACDFGDDSSGPEAGGPAALGSEAPVIKPVPVADKPNVVVVYTDDQDAESLAAMPHVNRLLAEHGTTFTRAYASTPQCCPSRATFLTGQYAHNHGVLDNRPPRGGFEALDGETTLPVWLSADGYRTAWVGRYLNQYGAPGPGSDPTAIPPGWSDWHVPVNRTEFRMYNYELNENGQLESYGSEPEDYLTDVLAERANSFVRESSAAGERFFLVVSPLAPHDEGVLERLKNPPRDPRPAPRHEGSFDDEPLPNPPGFNERDVSDKPSFVAQHPRLRRRDIAELTRAHRSRLESLQAVDELVAGLVRELRRADELDETLFIYTSDQGYLKGEHRLKGKERVYDPAVHVPLVIRGPGFPAGEARFQPTVSPDLARTIAAATGAQPNVALDGADLRPLARNPAKGSNREILLEFLSERHFAAVRTRRYVFAKHQNGEVELYDFREDPNQLVNVVTDPAYAEVARRLDNDLSELRVCAGTSCDVQTNPGKRG